MIEWTERTWNPLVGCTPVSPGCLHCYANAMSKRLAAMGLEKYKLPFSEVRLWGPALLDPIAWKRPSLVFLGSMTDVFHPDVPPRALAWIRWTMECTHQHVYQVLTKRPERCTDPLPYNVWLGTTVERADYLGRIDHIRRAKAAIKWLSLEPLLGPLDGLDLTGIDWVVVGTEINSVNGPGRRPCDPSWIESIQDQCKVARVPVLVKRPHGQKSVVHHVSEFPFDVAVKRAKNQHRQAVTTIASRYESEEV